MKEIQMILTYLNCWVETDSINFFRLTSFPSIKNTLYISLRLRSIKIMISFNFLGDYYFDYNLLFGIL